MIKTYIKLGHAVAKRYLTVERDIKAESNSFYASILELFEALLRIIYKENKIEVNEEYDTAIPILVALEKNKYFKDNKYKESLFEMTKALYEHKHNRELEISLNNVLIYTKYVYDLAKIHLETKGMIVDDFDNKEIEREYGLFNNENYLLQKDKEKLINQLLESDKTTNLIKSDLERIKQMKEESDSNLLSSEEKNTKLLKEINELKEIKLSTMEEKIVKIIDVLNRQTDMMMRQIEGMAKLSQGLDKANEALKVGVQNRFGAKPTVTPR